MVVAAATVSSSWTSSSSSSSRRLRGCSFYYLLVVAASLAAFGFGAALGVGDAAGGPGPDRVLLNVESLFPAGPTSPCSTPTQEHKHDAGTPTRMTIVHQHGPCSPLVDAHGKPPSHEEILAADQSRVESIQRRVSETTTGRGKRQRAARIHPGALRPEQPTTMTPQPAAASLASSNSPSLPASSGRALGTGNYVVTVGFGTPRSLFTVVFDTGSDTTWVRCQPCVAACYSQKEPLFDPARSSTYANVSCASPYCSDLDASGCSAGHCLYGVSYGDGSYTVGFFAQDTLTLGSYDTVKGFRFGCGEKNSGLFGQTAGLMGLGRGKTSLTVQAQDKYGGVLAYCLPATSSGAGYLEFGQQGSPAAGGAVALTPMLTENGPTFYYVGMTGIRVGGQQLAIPESVFSTAGTLVDSGTVITRLPPAAYAALRSAFAGFMSSRGYRAAPALQILDTCYDFTGLNRVALPTVSLVFQGGARLDVDASGIIYAASISQMCLAFAPNDDDGSVGIIGNTQQKTHAVLYDLGKKVVGFAPGAC